MQTYSYILLKTVSLIQRAHTNIFRFTLTQNRKHEYSCMILTVPPNISDSKYFFTGRKNYTLQRPCPKWIAKPLCPSSKSTL